MSYSPGPNGMTRWATKSNRPRFFGMTSRERLTTSMAGAVPVSQFTPDQEYFRANAQGRWQADFDQGAHAPVNAIRQDGNGCTDVVKLEPDRNPNGPDTYIDLGGKGATDYAVRQP
jgi:hypothetical protein